MGVDYTGNYGIGIKVLIPELTGEFEDYGDLEYLEELLEDSEDYYCFEVGSENYTGDYNELYVCIEEPFKDGYDITQKVNSLMNFIKENGLDFEGEVNEVGGLHIW